MAYAGIWNTNTSIDKLRKVVGVVAACLLAAC